jgi:lipopolysaccharide export LptBFGC system permease protein LptF
MYVYRCEARAGRIVRKYHAQVKWVPRRQLARYAMPAASLVVVLLLLARSRSANRLLLASQGAIACAMYFVLLVAGDVATRDGWLSGAVAAWLPNMLFVTAAAARSLRSRFVANGVQEV